MTTDYSHKVIRLGSGNSEHTDLNLIAEEPLSIRIQGNPYTVIMRTPGDEIAHVAGFCLGEGIVSSPDDFANLAYCEGDVNVVTATLTPERREKVSSLLSRRGFISQTSCGICGRELIDDMKQHIPRVDSDQRISMDRVISCLKDLSTHQPLRDKTRASHGSALYRSDGSLLVCAEDVGRHNALDKAVGRVFLDGKGHEVALLVLSSRISYELVQKAGRAKIPVVAGLSRPTAFAVNLAEQLGITLICGDGKGGALVFTVQERVTMS